MAKELDGETSFSFDYDEIAIKVAIGFKDVTGIKNKNQIDELYRKRLQEQALNSCLFDTETFAKDFTKLIRSL